MGSYSCANPKPDLAQLARSLKTACGTGGTVREGSIELQGDVRASVRENLESQGFRVG